MYRDLEYADFFFNRHKFEQKKKKNLKKNSYELLINVKMLEKHTVHI
jgi:hypothetical protein